MKKACKIILVLLGTHLSLARLYRGNIILDDDSLAVAAYPAHLHMEATGSSRHVIHRPIKDGRNYLHERTVVS